MATKKVTKSKVPEKKVFTDSEYSVKRIYQKSSKKRPTEDAGKYPFTRGIHPCLLYTSPSPRDATLSRMPSSA